MADELKISREKLEQQAFRDPLTKVYNRRYGMDALAKILEQGKAFSVCFIDLDNLKYVNDVLGHTEGDRFITTSAEQLDLEFNDGIVARLGGDEFMVILPGGTEDETERRVGRISIRLAEFGRRPDGTSRPPLSHGIIEVAAGSTIPASDILADADKKMYEVKAKHKAAYKDARKGVKPIKKGN
jgi:diguanylate cyclase (GGDEF)-like protein